MACFAWLKMVSKYVIIGDNFLKISQIYTDLADDWLIIN